jgi:hypothetical protein
LAAVGVAVGVAVGAALRFLAVLLLALLGLVLRTGVAGVEVSPAPSPPAVLWRPRVAGSRRRSFLL